MQNYFNLTEQDLEYIIKTFFAREDDWTIITPISSEYLLTPDEMNHYNSQRLQLKYRVRSVKYPKQTYTFYIRINNDGNYYVEQDVGGSTYAYNTFQYVDYMRTKGFPIDVSRMVIIDKILGEI